MSPASVGLRVLPVRQRALAASSQAEDFGGLFIGFSFFLITAALILLALLFHFAMEKRAVEVGTLLAARLASNAGAPLRYLDGRRDHSARGRTGPESLAASSTREDIWLA